MAAVEEWGGFGAILEEARKLDDELSRRPRTSCPRCGTPLDFNKDGVANCPMGHYRAHRPREMDAV